MPYMPCVCAHNGFGFGFNAGRACLLCARFVRSVLFFETTNTSPQGTIRTVFDAFGGVGT